MYRLRSYSDGQPVNIISWATSICHVTTKKLLRQRGTAVACMLHSFIFFFLCALLLYVISLAGWLTLSVLQPVHNDLWQCYVYYITVLTSTSSSCIKKFLCEFLRMHTAGLSTARPTLMIYTSFTGKMLPWSFWQVVCTASVPPGRFATFSRAPANQYNSYEQTLLDDGCQLSL